MHVTNQKGASNGWQLRHHTLPLTLLLQDHHYGVDTHGPAKEQKWSQSANSYTTKGKKSSTICQRSRQMASYTSKILVLTIRPFGVSLTEMERTCSCRTESSNSVKVNPPQKAVRCIFSLAVAYSRTREALIVLLGCWQTSTWMSWVEAWTVLLVLSVLTWTNSGSVRTSEQVRSRWELEGSRLAEPPGMYILAACILWV